MKFISYLLSGVGTALLVVVLFACGYFACAAPVTTTLLSQAFSDYERSPYSLDDLNTLAVASRDLTVDARPAGTTSADARTDFNERLMIAATHSAERYLDGSVNGIDKSNKEKRDLWTGLLQSLEAAAPTVAFTMENANATADAMAAHSDAFALDADAFRHLDDCNKLIQSGTYVITVFAIMVLVCLLFLALLRQRQALGYMLTLGPGVVLVAFVLLGVWAAFDFRSLFTVFHSVFFPQGNWTFSADSLLICMYPTAFWMGMAGVWLFTTVVASIILLVIGRKVLKGSR